jgi:hypothetical protein
VKASTRNPIIALTGIGFGFCGLFGSALGLPEWTELPFTFIFVASIWAVVWLQRRDRRRGKIVSTPSTAPQRLHARILVVTVVIASLSSPFWLPYTGTHLGFSSLVIVSVVSCVVSILVLLPGMKLRQRSNKSLEPTTGRSDE